MTWLRELLSDGTGHLSSSRAIAFMAGSTLSLCTLVLTPLAYLKPELVTPLTAFGTALAGLAGANYVTNRMTSGRTNDQPPA